MVKETSDKGRSDVEVRAQLKRWWTETDRPWTAAAPLLPPLVLLPMVCGALGYPWQPWAPAGTGRPAVPVAVWFGLIVAIVTSVVVARRARASLRGPVVIAGIVDSGPLASPNGPGATTGTEALVAIMRDRLARAGAEPRGVTPGASIDGESSLTLTASPVAGVSASAKIGLDVLLRPFRLRGWSVSGTLRNSPASGQVGITLVIEHVATKRIDLARTVWQDTAADAARWSAYHIAVWYQDRFFGTSNRTRPGVQLTPTSLKLFEDAEFFLSQRRFDEALEAASLGLGEDPVNIQLRRLRGEAHERLGHFQSALEVYASGLVMLHDVRNSWNYSEESDPQSSWPVMEKPIQSDEAAGLIWRYVAVLTFGDHWIDRWIADLAKYEAGLREERDLITGRRPAADFPSRWRGQEQQKPEERRIAELSEPERLQEREDRFEQAKRLRGFFHHRYHDLMEREFPLLHAAWFAERHVREVPFDRVSGPLLETPNSPRRWIAEEADRFPARIDAGKPGHPAYDRHALGGWARAEQRSWLDEVGWFFKQLQANSAGVGTQLKFGDYEPDTISDVAAEVRARLGVAPATSLAGLGEALTDESGWKDYGLDRVLLGEVVTWAARHVSLIVEETGRPHSLVQDQDRLAMLRAQLDLRLFFQRAAIEEVDRLCREEEVIVGNFAPRHLLQMLWLGTRYRYLNRMLTLTNRGDGQGRDPGQMNPAHDRNLLREVTTRTARESAERFSGLSRPSAAGTLADRQRWAEWTVYYYSACVHSIVMSEHPRREDDEAEPSVHDDAGARRARHAARKKRDEERKAQGDWVRRYDTLAKFAVRGLNHSLLVRRDGDVTPIKAGVLDWLLYEDPDLDQLRAHPRFQRWAASTFSLRQVDQDNSPAAVEAIHRFAELRREQWHNEGVYGLERRWRRGQRLWWLANDYYLVGSLLSIVPSVVLGWQRLAAGITADPEEWPDQLAAFNQRHSVDVATWRKLASFERFAARPMLRLSAARALAQLGGDGRPQPHFPVTRDVLNAGVHLNYRRLIEEVSTLLEDGANAGERFRDRGAGTGSWLGTARLVRNECYAAATRWQRLHDAVLRQTNPTGR